MTDRPIIFSAPMVRALLDGRKTQTRRIVKDRGALPEFCGGRYDNKNDPTNYGWQDYERGEWITLDMFRRYRFVPYSHGDRLWVKETFTKTQHGTAVYRADATDETGQRWHSIAVGDPNREVKWTSPIFMPRTKSRLTLIVTDVRVQRLQEISHHDAVSEGVQPNGMGATPVDQFADLWNSIHGPDAWDANPWVAAISFTVHRGNIDAMTPTPDQRE